MFLKVCSSSRIGKIGLAVNIVFGLALLVGFSLVGQADPYQEATAGREPIIGLSYFGTHFHRLALNPGERNLQTRWPESGIGTIRLWDSDTLWTQIDTKPGQWEYGRMDTYVYQATIHHATVLYTFGGTPRWASARRDEKCPYGLGACAEPVRMAHWEEYVRRVVQRYHGRIKAYELWNEPNFSDIPRDRNQPAFYTGSVANMVEMARIARKVLDENDPDAVLSTPGFTNGPDRLELFLESGGKKYVQAVAYHFYSESSDQFVKQVVEVRDVMKRQGIENFPLWDTETGVEVHPLGTQEAAGVKHLTFPEAASRLAQFLILGSAVGLEHFYQYAWDNPNSGMLTMNGESLPNQNSYEKVQAWLIGAKMLGCKKVLPRAVLCEGERAGNKFAIAWSDTPGSYLLPAPSGWTDVSLEHLVDTNVSKFTLKNNGKGDRVELSFQPLYIQYKPRS
jgi:hypothetical protein